MKENCRLYMTNYSILTISKLGSGGSYKCFNLLIDVPKLVGSRRRQRRWWNSWGDCPDCCPHLLHCFLNFSLTLHIQYKTMAIQLAGFSTATFQCSETVYRKTKWKHLAYLVQFHQTVTSISYVHTLFKLFVKSVLYGACCSHLDE